jgi:hypothetical protein
MVIEPTSGINEFVVYLSDRWKRKYFRPVKQIMFGDSQAPALYYLVHNAPHWFFLLVVFGAADDVAEDVISFRNDYGADFVGCVSINVDDTVDDGVASFFLNGLTDEQLNRCDVLCLIFLSNVTHRDRLKHCRNFKYGVPVGIDVARSRHSFGVTVDTMTDDNVSNAQWDMFENLSLDRNHVHAGFVANVRVPPAVNETQRLVLGHTLWMAFELPKCDNVQLLLKSPRHPETAGSQIAVVSRRIVLSADSIQSTMTLSLMINEGCSEFRMRNVPMSVVRSLQVQRLMAAANGEDTLFGFPLQSLKLEPNPEQPAPGDSSALFEQLQVEQYLHHPADELSHDVRQNRESLSRSADGSVWRIDAVMQRGDVAVTEKANACRIALKNYQNLVDRYLASLRTFGESTPLHDNHFVRLRTIEHTSDALLALMADGVMTLFNDNDNDDNDDNDADDDKTQDGDHLFKQETNVIVLGEAGQGKTSLLRHWMNKSTSEHLVLYVRADTLWLQFQRAGAVDVGGLATAVKKGFDASLTDEDRKEVDDLLSKGIVVDGLCFYYLTLSSLQLTLKV